MKNASTVLIGFRLADHPRPPGTPRAVGTCPASPSARLEAPTGQQRKAAPRAGVCQRRAASRGPGCQRRPLGFPRTLAAARPSCQRQPRPVNSPARRVGTPIPVPGRIGNRGFPVSRPNRESGFPPRFPVKTRESGDPIPDSRVTSEHQPQCARVMPVLSQAACGSYSGSKRGSMLLRVTSINRSGLRLGIYSLAAASIMPVLSQAACGSYSGSDSERGNMQLSSASLHLPRCACTGKGSA